DTVSNHVRPYWPTEGTTASDSEDPAGTDRLRVETKVNVELHPENKLNHIGERERDGLLERDKQMPGILKNKISYPPPLTDKNMKNRLREKLSDYNSPTITSPPPINNYNTSALPPSSVNVITPSSRPSSQASTDGGGRLGNHDHSSLVKPPVAPRPQIPIEPSPGGIYRETNGGVAMHLKSGTVNGGNNSDSE
ncbi:hypothetical protein GOODEAATRI_012002, partial [Goodea atripinnis]